MASSGSFLSPFFFFHLTRRQSLFLIIFSLFAVYFLGVFSLKASRPFNKWRQRFGFGYSWLFLATVALVFCHLLSCRPISSCICALALIKDKETGGKKIKLYDHDFHDNVNHSDDEERHGPSGSTSTPRLSITLLN